MSINAETCSAELMATAWGGLVARRDMSWLTPLPDAQESRLPLIKPHKRLELSDIIR